MSKFRIILGFAAICFLSHNFTYAAGDSYPADCQDFRLDGRDVLPAVDPSEISQPEKSKALLGKPLAKNGGIVKAATRAVPSANLLHGQVALLESFWNCYAISEYYIARMAIAKSSPKQSCSFHTPDLFALEDPAYYFGSQLTHFEDMSKLIAPNDSVPGSGECRLAKAFSQYGLCSFQGKKNYSAADVQNALLNSILFYRAENEKSLPAKELETDLLEQFCIQAPLAPLGAKTTNLGQLFKAFQSKNEANFLIESYQSACNSACNQASKALLKNLTCHEDLTTGRISTTPTDDNELRSALRQNLQKAAQGKALPNEFSYPVSVLEVPGVGGNPCEKVPTRSCAACDGSSPQKCRGMHSTVLLGERCKHRSQNGRCDSCQALITGSWGADCNYYRTENISEVQPDFYWSPEKDKKKKSTLQCTGHIWIDYDRLIPGANVRTSYAN